MSPSLVAAQEVVPWTYYDTIDVAPGAEVCYAEMFTERLGSYSKTGCDTNMTHAARIEGLYFHLRRVQLLVEGTKEDRRRIGRYCTVTLMIAAKQYVHAAARLLFNPPHLVEPILVSHDMFLYARLHPDRKCPLLRDVEGGEGATITLSLQGAWYR